MYWRTNLLLSALWSLPMLGMAQHWAVKCGGVGNERVNDVKAGPGDVVFSTGEFGPGSTVAGQPLVSQGLSDVFVMKQTAAGVLQWLTQAGGGGLDLAGRVCAAPDGSVVVCGQFSGTADLFGTSVTAQGGSTDFFVAKLSGADGALVWVRTGGSATYTDRAANVAVGADGRVVVTGEFRGTGVFDAGTFNSTIDPNTSLPGSDVFIASYAANGTAEWFKQGVAERDDQAADVALDASGATYAYGLYSETISFGTPHPNVALNQIYLVKFDAGGSEQWFRRIGGAALQQPVDMQLGDAGGIFLCGNVQGTLSFFDTAPNTVPSAQPGAYFLVRASTDGEFDSGIAIGSVNAVSAVGLDQRGATVAVYGSFVCGFADLQAYYNATGIFIATGEEDLFIAKHNAQSAALVEAQQFGGHLAKDAGGITSLGNGELVFCGDFSELLIFPSEDDGWGEELGPCTPFAIPGATYCGDPHYTDYEAIESTGALDGFIARGYVDSREPYDPFSRSGSGCDRSFLDVVVYSQNDGITDNALVCGGDTLRWVHNIHRPACPACSCPMDRTVSWDVTDLWSTGQDYFDTTIIWNTGWYWRTQVSSNGCYDVSDSIYITVLPRPSAWVSADGGPLFPGNTPSPNVLTNCAPMELLAADLLLGETAQWTINGVPVSGNPIMANATGIYELTVTSPNGCTGVNTIDFTLLQDIGIPNITSADFDFYFNAVPLDVQDTAQVCDAVFLQGYVLATWYVDGVPTVLGQPYIVFTTTQGGGGTSSYANAALSWFIPPGFTGWYGIQLHMVMNVEGCSNDSAVFNATDSIYIATGFTPDMAPLEDISLCIGDTAVVVLDCEGCTSVEWSGPGTVLTSAGQDTAWISDLGQYSVIGTNANGVLCVAVEYFTVSQALPPPLVLDPLAVCPGDAAILSTPFVSAMYEWSGPSGPIPVDNDSLTIFEIGSYYLTAYTDEGCALFAGPAVLQQFATPNINAVPDAVLCPGESTALVISGGGVEQVFWDPPLSGSGSTQSVNAAGTYTCTVVSCADTFQLSVTIYASSVSAVIPTGPFTICGGGSVLLDGPAGDYDYLWTPGDIATEDLLATTPDTYQLQLTDSLGCTALSNIVQVVEQVFTEQLAASGDTICPGDDAFLSATGSGTLVWYPDADMQDTLAVGVSVVIVDATVSDTIYVSQTEDGCTGPLTPVLVTVTAAEVPVIGGDTLLCFGDVLSLFVTAVPGTTYAWTTPQGAVSGPSVNIAPMTAADTGTYVCTATVGGCAGAQASVTVTLEAGPPSPSILGDTALCVGDQLLLSVEVNAGVTYTWSTPFGEEEGPTVVVDGVVVTDAGIYACAASTGACAGEPGEVTVTVDLPPQTPTVTGPDVLCEGESGSLSVSGVAPSGFIWVTPGGSFPGSGSSLPLVGGLQGGSGSYGVVVDGGGCPDVSAFVEIAVDPCDLLIPNVITPNSDGDNDLLLLEAAQGSNFMCTIQNRWGQDVWNYSGPVIRWTGRDNDNEVLTDGVYFYAIQRYGLTGDRTFTGYIQLLGGK